MRFFPLFNLNSNRFAMGSLVSLLSESAFMFKIYISGDFAYNHGGRLSTGILEWMEKDKFEHSEYALHLNILCKVKGICEAEKYFDSLPPEVKKGFVYGALLNCYCTGKMPESIGSF